MARFLTPRLLSAALGLLLPALALSASFAEDGEPPEDDVSAQVKAQMEKIIRLMRENEQALLELSAGRDATPKPVDVEVPEGQEPPPSGSSSGGERGGSQGAPRGGEAVRQALEEMIRGQRQSSSGIPGELEELVRMIPT
jgi:hypothetical protein